MRLTKTQRETLRSMFDGLCAYCGQPLGDRWHADHVEAVERKIKHVAGVGFKATGELWRPERDHVGNLVPACPPCNIDKHNLSVEQWRRKLEGACGVLQRNEPTYRHAVRFGLVQETGAQVVFHFERLAASPAEPAASSHANPSVATAGPGDQSHANPESTEPAAEGGAA